jgi:predicted P-loop ATPase
LSGLTSTELMSPDRYDDMERVVERFLKGEQPTTIAKQTGFKRAYVMELVEEYRTIAANDTRILDRAREAIFSMDRHYNMILEKLWEVVEQADEAENLTAKNNALKNAADIEAKRLDALQKAGLVDNAGLGEELIAMEEKAEAIKELLKEVAVEYPESREMIQMGLSRIFGAPEPVVVRSNPV